MILDATCSTKKIWPRFASLRMDIKREVKPDVCASATHLPFRDGIFQEIYCDPPHVVGHQYWIFSELHRQEGYDRFGAWDSLDQWFMFLEHVNIEAARCLELDGLLHFKVLDGAESHRKERIQFKDLIRLTNFESARPPKRVKSGIGNRYGLSTVVFATYRLTMRPKP